LPKILSLIEISRQSSQLIAPYWPLQWWGISIIGKLTLAEENYTFAIVAVEYFIKWIEVNPVTNVSSATIQKISGKTSSAITEFYSKSQSTMLSISITTCSRISVIR
jgi:hypothetical protein